jgi:enamine deaminase RidA (YjgF/YER057c/UK114 family)
LLAMNTVHCTTSAKDAQLWNPWRSRLQPEGLLVSPAFSHVAVVPAGATTIYVGGQNGVDADGKIVSDDVGEQSARAIDNASTALEAAGTVP